MLVSTLVALYLTDSDPWGFRVQRAPVVVHGTLLAYSQMHPSQDALMASYLFEPRADRKISNRRKIIFM